MLDGDTELRIFPADNVRNGNNISSQKAVSLCNLHSHNTATGMGLKEASGLPQILTDFSAYSPVNSSQRRPIMLPNLMRPVSYKYHHIITFILLIQSPLIREPFENYYHTF